MDSIQQVKWDIWRRDHYFKEGQEAHDAFELAITEGLLSRLESAPNYSGDYMLMQTRIIDNVDFSSVRIRGSTSETSTTMMLIRKYSENPNGAKWNK